MAMCTSVLLGDPPPSFATPLTLPHHRAVAAINEVIRHHAPYWRSLRIHIPNCVRASLSSPKHRGKGVSKGKGSRKSDLQLLPPAAREDEPSPDSSLEQLAQGLAGLDISQTSDTPTPPTSTPVGGARLKVHVSPQKGASGDEVKSEPSAGQSAASIQPQPVKETASDEAAAGEGAEPEAEGACGWSKAQTCLELFCGAEPGRDTMYVVNPLSWCPHLDNVKPLPPSGIDVFLPCQDCGSAAENWICLTCYQVFCGRYVNGHMLSHGVMSEHHVVLSFADLSVWCYMCEAYIHNKTLLDAKNAAHCAKFGEEIPPWS
ncbi:hypothetical protein LDENG_00086580 [Lucifuga dentata]|nr:hypothetical protein LDENG_00086580 [Lucifuga dentata]